MKGARIFDIYFLCIDFSLWLPPSLHRINSSKACGPFVNYNTSWEVLPLTVSELPHGFQSLIYALSSEAFAVSFFVVTWYVFLSGAAALMVSAKLDGSLLVTCLSSLPCSLAMFYVIALAGAHKRVINQLREQLAMVFLALLFV